MEKRRDQNGFVELIWNLEEKEIKNSYKKKDRSNTSILQKEKDNVRYSKSNST